MKASWFGHGTALLIAIGGIAAIFSGWGMIENAPSGDGGIYGLFGIALIGIGGLVIAVTVVIWAITSVVMLLRKSNQELDDFDDFDDLEDTTGAPDKGLVNLWQGYLELSVPRKVGAIIPLWMLYRGFSGLVYLVVATPGLGASFSILVSTLIFTGFGLLFLSLIWPGLKSHVRLSGPDPDGNFKGSGFTGVVGGIFALSLLGFVISWALWVLPAKDNAGGTSDQNAALEVYDLSDPALEFVIAQKMIEGSWALEGQEDFVVQFEASGKAFTTDEGETAVSGTWTLRSIDPVSGLHDLVVQRETNVGDLVYKVLHLAEGLLVLELDGVEQIYRRVEPGEG